MDTAIEVSQDAITLREAGEAQLIDLWIQQNDSPHTRRAYAAVVQDFSEFICRIYSPMLKLDQSSKGDLSLHTVN